MANEKVTSLEVAALAGVSQSAVSRVFTPGSSVSVKTAEKVRAAAAQLGYRPNVLARSLKSGKSRIIGLVAMVPFFVTVPYTGPIAAALLVGRGAAARAPSQ